MAPRDVLALLTALPHRGSATPLEHQALERLRNHLTAHGHTPEIQRFRAPQTYGWELLFISLLIALGGLRPNVWLALIGVYWFWAYFDGWGTPWDDAFAAHPSHNVIARAGGGGRKVVLMAHYDSAKTFFLYHPRRVRTFRQNFLLNAALATAAVPLILGAPVAGRIVGVYFLLQAVLLFSREMGAPYVNGANDNASGVAVAVQLFLDTAPALPPDAELWLLLTGAEEVGARGARAFLRANNLPKDALILNIDNVGKGDLFFAEGEGMLRFYRYHGALLDAARRLGGAAPLQYRLAYFDTLPFARAGYPCLTLIRLEGGVPPNWHWPTDTMENLDTAAVDATLEYARRLLGEALGLITGAPGGT